MTSKAARQAEQAAEALLDWLDRPRPFGAQRTFDSEGRGLPEEDAPCSATAQVLLEAPCLPTPQLPKRQIDRAPARAPVTAAAAALTLPNPDWLHHRLTVEGAPDKIACFQQRAAGAGVIPWRLDLDRIEEDAFLRLVSPPPPHTRSLSIAGARILSRQLRNAVDVRHTLATARVGQSRACPFDLHALVPVPDDILGGGPDFPEVLSWLWEHWGTTHALRHVTVDMRQSASTDVRNDERPNIRLGFWSADWSPWRALEKLRLDWPGLRFDLRPDYDR